MTKILLSAAVVLCLMGGGAQAHTVKKGVYINTPGPGGVVIGKTVGKKTCVVRHNHHVHRYSCARTVRVRPVVVLTR